MKRVPALDGVRGLAVLLVLLVHTYDMQMPEGTVSGPVATLLGAGWMGVPLFFVLSGFLVGGPLVASVAEGRFSFARFYMDRTLRIFPIAYVFLAVWGLHEHIAGLNYWTVTSLLYVSQWFGIESPTHFWSLQVEEQFYMLAPVLVVFAMRREKVTVTGIERFLKVGVVGWQIARVLCFTALRGHAALLPPVYVNGLSYLDLFFAGTLLSLWHRDGRLATKMAPFRAWFASRGLKAHAGGALLLASFVPLALATAPMNARVVERDGFVFAVTLSLLVVWCSAVIAWFATSREDDGLARAFGSKPAKWLATLSYSIYVWHWFFIYTLRIPSLGIVAQFAFDVAAMSGIAAASYFLIEKRFLVIRDMLRAKPAPREAAVAVA